MHKKIIIDANFASEVRVAVLNNNSLENIEFESVNKALRKGNIYLAKVTWIESALQAAFINYGNDKNGFLPFSEIHPDYYNIPISDKNTVNNLHQIAPPTIDPKEMDDKLSTDHISSSSNGEVISTFEEHKSAIDVDIEASETDLEVINPQPENQNVTQYKIHEVIKKNQILLVQVTKEERGNKGASFTTHISLAGKYCVLMPNKAWNSGISRKISNVAERKRLKDIVQNLISEQDKQVCSIIVRTAGIGRSSIEIKKDYDYLVRLWNKIREITLASNAPCFIHEEDGIIHKTIRDLVDKNVRDILIQGREAFFIAKKFMKDISPSEIAKVKEYNGKLPIFTKFNIEDQILKLYQPIVQLPSGGYIVINPTEAMISIDVNSGKSTSERNIEETALKTNIEATKEIAKQIMLRDLSGLLVIDFIDMHEFKNRKVVEKSFKECFTKDKARVQISHISALGLLEMSRQRLRPSFLESNSKMCIQCCGKGLVRGDDANAMLMLRTIENEISNSTIDSINVFANAQSIIYLLNHKRAEIGFIEDKHKISIKFYIEHNVNADSYSIEKVRLAQKSPSETPNKPVLQDTSDIYQSLTVPNTENNAPENVIKSEMTKKRKWKNFAPDSVNAQVQNDSEVRPQLDQQSSNTKNLSKNKRIKSHKKFQKSKSHNSIPQNMDPL